MHVVRDRNLESTDFMQYIYITDITDGQSKK